MIHKDFNIPIRFLRPNDRFIIPDIGLNTGEVNNSDNDNSVGNNVEVSGSDEVTDNSNTPAKFNPNELNIQLRSGEITLDKFLQILRENSVLYNKTQENNIIIINYKFENKEYEVICKVQTQTDTEEPNAPEETQNPPEAPKYTGAYDTSQVKGFEQYFEDKDSDGHFDIKKGITADGKAITTLEELKEALADEKITIKIDNTITRAGKETSPNNAAETLRNPIADVAESIVSVCKEAINFHNNIKIGYSIDANGNIQFPQRSDAEKVFNTILERLKSRINRYTPDALKEIGGEEVLKKLLQSAWAEASSGVNFNSSINTGDFINKVMKNLDKILEKTSSKPEYLDYYIKDCYQDQTLINNLPNISDTKINYTTPKKFDTGEMHLDNDASDKKFQETMNKLLENIYKKYPNIDKQYLKQTFFKAQENALKYSDIPDGMDIKQASVFYYNTRQFTGTMKDLVNLVLYHFDKLFKADAKDKVFDARKEDAPETAPVSSQTAERNNQIKSGSAGISDYVADVSESIVAVCKEAINNKEKIHTEFGMDSSGNIVFQEKNTQKVFDTIFDRLKSRINRYASASLQELGGENVLKQLLQAAWITAYNDFASSQKNNTRDFINKVMSNLEKILNKLQTNPELMEIFTKRTSYTDSSLTNGLKHYNTKTTSGNDETILYKGEVTIYADASIHISNTNDDNDYQQTMTPLLERLIKKYPSLSKDTITQVFRNAQKKALEALQSNKSDCPYGTGNNSGRVEDSRKDWSGKDNRKKDDYKIHMDQLVQMTLYYFDKLIYAELLK